MCPAEYAPADREKRPDSEHRREPVVAPRPTAPPLVVGAADDRAEREADRIADEVISRLQGDQHEVAEPTAAFAVHRSVAPPGTDAAVEVGRDGGPLSDGLSSRIDRRRGAGTALSGPVRERMETGFGRSLSGVRIHHDAESAQLNRSVAARAFTTGNDIFFGAGEYQPDTPAGERVLAHELAHTQQQGGGARRQVIHRRWDIDAPQVPWRDARHVRTLESRRVWFVADSAGDEMVVKPEDQPVGLGDLAAAMQKRVTKVKSVKQRKLAGQDKTWIDGLIGREVAIGERSWERRGHFLGPKAQPQPVTDYFEKLQLAERDAQEGLWSQTNNVVAMTLASGESAAAVATRNTGGESGLREVLDRRGHARKLGKLTAVDLFLGNADRMVAINLGNWFYDPEGAMTLIDQVDPNGMVAGFKNPTDNNGNLTWHTQTELANANLASTARQCIRSLTSEAKYFANDQGIDAWLNETEDGLTRKARLEAEFEQGMKDGKKRIAKVFKTTRKNVFSRSTRKVKKKLKAAAGAAAQVDTGDAQYGNGAPNYYDVLKQRAAWVDKN